MWRKKWRTQPVPEWVKDEMVKLVEDGNYVEVAAAHCNVSTASAWRIMRARNIKVRELEDRVVL